MWTSARAASGVNSTRSIAVVVARSVSLSPSPSIGAPSTALPSIHTTRVESGVIQNSWVGTAWSFRGALDPSIGTVHNPLSSFQPPANATNAASGLIANAVTSRTPAFRRSDGDEPPAGTVKRSVTKGSTSSARYTTRVPSSVKRSS
jgi:hypothetical protein